MNAFKNAKWIWVDKDCKPDTYGEFYSEFDWQGKSAEIFISCDSDYTLYVNGKYVASNQYGDFEWYKSVDRLNIGAFLKKGKNTVAITVWYFGVNTQRYLKAKAGLIFEIFEKEKSVLASGEKTLSRYSRAYKNGEQKFITTQLGFSFCYDANFEDGWMTTGKDLTPSVLVDKNCSFIFRPIDKLTLLDRVESKIIRNESNHCLIDLGREVVGLIKLDFISNSRQSVTVAWGESLDGEHVRKNIDIRDFSFTYIAKEGVNEYVNYMLRLGCRYVEVWTESPIEINYIGIIPQVYPIKEKPLKLENELDQRIYNASVNTLKLCMMEHYVDTPWREQCLYAYDSRNQILCGYYAFNGGNIEYAKANLRLIGQDRREDGLLSICSPCGADLTIPSFSLYYFIALKEYLDYTGDKSLLIDLYPKLLQIVEVFTRQIKDGLVCKFDKVCHWNFYDWTDYLSSAPFAKEDAIPDAMINILFIIALRCFREISQTVGKTFDYEEVLKECKIKTRATFFRNDKGLFELTKGGGEFTVLANSLAIISGITDREESIRICESIERGDLIDCSLSMKIFKYESMLITDEKRWSEWVFNEIREEYGNMVEKGETVWETSKGSVDFDNAGSLCHGWSSVPVYFYNKFFHKP
ncbi:MAG: hypothetical protein E7360_06860 [Clostridiales bacterium]|nr:hypothetical protein [Clostridiales bacterium]